MKYVLLAILVLIAAQPLQASPCDMRDGQDTSHSQHGNMHDGDMSGMDCCDHDPTDTGDGCGSMSHCGACTASLVTVSLSTFNTIFDPASKQFLLATKRPPNRYSSPPFRPPIT